MQEYEILYNRWPRREIGGILTGCRVTDFNIFIYTSEYSIDIYD
jgi:hypothetical protein